MLLGRELFSLYLGLEGFLHPEQRALVKFRLCSLLAAPRVQTAVAHVSHWPHGRQRITGLTLPTRVLTAPELEERRYLEGRESKGENPGNQTQVGKDIVGTASYSETRDHSGV